MEHYSFSRLNRASQCLRLYWALYEAPERLPQVTSFMQESGKGVHACIEKYKAHCHATGVEQDLEVLSMIVEEVMSSDRELRTTAVYDDVFWTFRSFAQQYRHNAERYIGSEFLVTREVPGADAMIEGYPDHIETMFDDGGLIIVSDDVKSGFKKEVSEENRFQGEIMAWMLMEWFPGKRTGWRVNFPRADNRSEIEELLPVAVPRLEGHLRADIARIRRAREENRWPETPGDGCDYCPIAAACRKRAMLAAEDAVVNTPAEAEAAAHDIIIIEAARERRLEQLKAWAKREGPIAVNDVLVGYIPKTGGLRITDAMELVWQLGRAEAVAQVYAKSPDDPWLKDEANQPRILSLGIVAALDAGLLSVNGNKTKTKATQADPRLVGLWEPGETKTEFGIVAKAKAQKATAP